MSFIDDIVSTGKSILGAVTGNGLGSTILRTVISGMALNTLTKSINKSNDTPTTKKAAADQGVNVQVSASTENKIPVLYGRAVTGGQLVDVRMTPDAQTMYYVYALSEVTGNLLSTGAASSVNFNNIYWNGYKILFQSDGITAAALQDLQGTQSTKISGLVKVYCYRNGSTAGIVPIGYSGSVPPAWSVVPGWSISWPMTNLVFVVVEVHYNKLNGIVGIGNMTFDIENTMSLPGDVLYDLITNDRYGAGIPASDIKDY